MTIDKTGSVRHRQEIGFIQILRGLAALVVVILHAGWDHADAKTRAPLRHILSCGIAGVDLFFIISGFIMAYGIASHAGGTRNAAHFAVKRACRIWPPYVIWTLLLVGLYVMVPYSNTGKVPAGLGDVWRSLLFLPTSRVFFPPSYTLPILDVGWTLYYEAYFYVVLSLCLLGGRTKWLLFAIWLLFAMILIPWVQHRLTLDPNQLTTESSAWLNTLTSPIMWEFASGMFIGWLYKRDICIRHQGVSWIMLGLGAIALVAQCASQAEVLHGLTHLGGPIFVMVLAMSWLRLTADGLLMRPLHWLGTISYSLYLAHRPVIIALETMLSLRMMPLSGPKIALFILSSLLLSIAIAALSYRWLEIKLSNGLRDHLLRRTLPAS